ncbi:pentatricopeptide repeat-containing protein [Tanacetum coccineum]
MEEALVLFKNMMSRGIRPNTITFNVIIDGFGKSGNINSLLNMYEKMLEFGCRPDVITFTSILDGYCRIGDLHKGLEIWDEINRRNLYPNIYTFSILINTLCKEGRFIEARDLLRQLKQRGDIVPKAFIYNPVIDGFCKAGNVDEANLIVTQMEENKCKPDKLTFTILIIGHCAKGRMVEAISLFDKMMIVGCDPDLVTVNSLVSRLLKAGMPKEAFEIRKAALGVRVPRADALYRKNVDTPVAVTLSLLLSGIKPNAIFQAISVVTNNCYYIALMQRAHLFKLWAMCINCSAILTLAVGSERVSSLVCFPGEMVDAVSNYSIYQDIFLLDDLVLDGNQYILKLVFPNSHQLLDKVTYTASVILQLKGWVVLLL